MATETNDNKSMQPWQRMLLVGVAATYLVLFGAWFSNVWLGSPLLGMGDVEDFGRQYEATAAHADMTWRIAPGMGHMSVNHRINPPASASKITRVKQIEKGKSSVVYLVKYESDSQTVYGVLGVPNGEGPWPTALLCHPSDDNYTSGFHTQDTVKHLSEMGVYSLSIDYRGWGKSEGSRGNEVRDVWNALATLRQDPNVVPSKIALIGYSMGGGIAARAAAADTNIAALVLFYAQMQGSIEELRNALEFGEVAPGSGGVVQIIQQAAQAGADKKEMEYLIKMISPIYHLRNLKAPVYLFHGERDAVVNVLQSEALQGERRNDGLPVELFLYNKDHAFANSIENDSKRDFSDIIRKSLLAS
ncbi:MAG: dienelactone hydrolase family protein [Candidatus Lindowbacteria bacterium]|nr:dienelactone hydrolase family protein [Candidatus Lindowbacteria bacterium]